ncbi:MAG: hypothetical protein AAF602_15970 [Myxococcota bacterium]
MSMKYVAVEGCTVEVVAPTQGSVSITSQPVASTLGGGSGMYTGQLQISASNLTQASFGTATPGTATGAIPATAVTTVGGQPVLRVGDRVDGLLSSDAQMPSASGTVPSPITFSVEITDAGQSKVKVA